MNIDIIYEDNHLIAVQKEHGVLLDDLEGSLKKYIKERDHKPGNVYLGTIHQLDRPVGGIVLFGKTSKGASRLSEQWRNRQVKKTYHAIVGGSILDKPRHLVHYIDRDNNRRKVIVSDKYIKGYDEAVMSYDLVKKIEDFYLIKINLQTGRHHQIRAQLSHMGCPILGDIKYGSKISFKDHQIALSATGLSFFTATGEGIDGVRDRINLEIPVTLPLDISKWK